MNGFSQGSLFLKAANVIFSTALMIATLGCAPLYELVNKPPLTEAVASSPNDLRSSKVVVWADACVLKDAAFRSRRGLRQESIALATKWEKELARVLAIYGVEHEVADIPLVCADTVGAVGRRGVVLESWDGQEAFPDSPDSYPFLKVGNSNDGRDKELAQSLVQLRCHYLEFAEAYSFEFFRSYRNGDFHVSGAGGCEDSGTLPLNMEKLRGAFGESDYVLMLWAQRKLRTLASSLLADGFSSSESGYNVALFDLQQGKFVWGGHPKAKAKNCDAGADFQGGSDTKLHGYLKPLLCRQDAI